MISAKDIIEGLTHVSHFCQGDHLKDFYNRNGYVQGVSLYFGETSHYMAYISLFCDATIMKRWQKCTGVAGSSSSLLGCPAELIMIQQQKSGRGLIQEASQYVSKFGARQLYRGLVSHLRETPDELWPNAFVYKILALAAFPSSVNKSERRPWNHVKVYESDRSVLHWSIVLEIAFLLKMETPDEV